MQTTEWVKPRTRGFLPTRVLLSAKTANGRGRCEPNEKMRISIHPLFFLMGIFYSFIGELPLFLMSVIIAIEHELAHAISASRLGYQLNKIVLMPYGAVIDGDLKEISLKDELSVALAGPLCNFLTAGAFAALWWFYPTAYAFTDTACFLSLSIALVNLIPAYPLDGGRVLKCALTAYFLNARKSRVQDAQTAEKRAEKTCRVVAFLIAIFLFVTFVVLRFRAVTNYPLLVFSLFLGVGSFPSRQDAVYSKINFSNLSALEHGLAIRRVAVLSNTKIKNVLRYLCRGKYLILEVYDNAENFKGEIRQSELAEFFAKESLYAKIGEILEKKTKNDKKSQKQTGNFLQNRERI